MRFIIQKSENLEKWVCTDKVNNIVCIFENGNFNNTQKFSILEDFNPANYMGLAKIAKEMADWLKENHYDKIF